MTLTADGGIVSHAGVPAAAIRDQRRYTQCLSNVLNVNDKHDDTREDE
jgi:hypothetical protein